MTTMLETLNETAAAYTRNTRAVDPENGGCRYFMNGRCCAVGRCMLNPEQHENYLGGVNRFSDLDALLKSEYRGFPIDFWRDLQDLHDWEDNWDENGLTETGKTKVANIKEEFEL